MRLAIAIALVCTAACNEEKPASEPASTKARDAAASDDAAPSPVDVAGNELANLERPAGVPPLSRAEVSTAASRRARRLNVQGLRHYESRDYPAAIAAYKQALTADPGHLLARYNLSCAYNLNGEPDKGLALLAEFRIDGCDECLARLERASEDADWHSMWDHPLFIEIVGFRATAESRQPFWKRGDAACPAGASLVGEVGRAVFCARRGVKQGPSARWHPGGELAEVGAFERGAREGGWKEFRADGSLRAAGPYREGKKHGAWSEWHQGGGQASDGRYANGLRVGRWTWLDKDGAITRQATYERGKLIGEERTE